MWRCLLATVFWFGCSAAGAAVTHAELLRQSIGYVRGLDDRCTYTDGYACAEPPAPLASRAQLERMVPAVYLRAWAVAYDDFRNLADLTPEQKDLKHYRIGFSEDGDQYVVLFRGLLLPEIVDGRPRGVLRAVFGRSTEYWIDKGTLKISKRLYHP